MNREETKKAIEVMQAFVNGAEIECRGLNCRWLAASSPAWKGPYEFRVKPKSPEIQFMHSGVHGCPTFSHSYTEQLEPGISYTFVLKGDS